MHTCGMRIVRVKHSDEKEGFHTYIALRRVTNKSFIL